MLLKFPLTRDAPWFGCSQCTQRWSQGHHQSSQSGVEQGNVEECEGWCTRCTQTPELNQTKKRESECMRTQPGSIIPHAEKLVTRSRHCYHSENKVMHATKPHPLKKKHKKTVQEIFRAFQSIEHGQHIICCFDGEWAKCACICFWMCIYTVLVVSLSFHLVHFILVSLGSFLSSS